MATQLKREIIGIDISPTACNLMKRRLAKVGNMNAKLVGMPSSVDDLKLLKPFEFQNWIIDRVNGIQSARKSGDMGIDGLTFMLHEPIQIKQSEHVGRNVVDNFETAIEREGKTRGFVIAFSFTRGAHEEVARAKHAKKPAIHLITVKELLDKLDEVTALMGLPRTLGGMAALPLPQLDAKRHTVEELLESDRGIAPKVETPGSKIASAKKAPAVATAKIATKATGKAKVASRKKGGR